MGTKITLKACLVGLLFITGCASLNVVSDFDREADFKSYKTYGFYEKGLAKITVNDLDRKRLMRAVDAEMLAKGFSKADKNPDLWVNLVVVKRERVDVYNNGFMGPWGWRAWGWGPYWGGPMNYDRYEEGTIIIDFLDPKTKMHIWHGRGMGFNLDNFKNRDERINEGVKEILAQYPPNSQH